MADEFSCVSCRSTLRSVPRSRWRSRIGARLDLKTYLAQGRYQSAWREERNHPLPGAETSSPPSLDRRNGTKTRRLEPAAWAVTPCSPRGLSPRSSGGSGQLPMIRCRHLAIVPVLMETSGRPDEAFGEVERDGACRKESAQRSQETTGAAIWRASLSWLVRRFPTHQRPCIRQFPGGCWFRSFGALDGAPLAIGGRQLAKRVGRGFACAQEPAL